MLEAPSSDEQSAPVSADVTQRPSLLRLGVATSMIRNEANDAGPRAVVHNRRYQFEQQLLLQATTRYELLCCRLAPHPDEARLDENLSRAPTESHAVDFGFSSCSLLPDLGGSRAARTKGIGPVVFCA